MDGINRIGVWVRDSTKGIGTITYYDPSSGIFGALGHGIMDVDTKQLMSVKSGWIMSSKVTSIKKGMKGTPGELEGAVEKEKVVGQIKANTPCGIYGTADPSLTGAFKRGLVKVATQSLIREGPAVVLTNVSSNEVEEYEIEIESINRFAADETKGMVIRITDPQLLKLTNGIVQGMSGSPILQNGRLVGAVTHVFVQDPTKGYAIFIENMLKNAESVTSPTKQR
jgi:stage IV sporulation protein B